MTNQQQPDEEFSQFQNLPAEIRIMIWNLCLPHRVHELNKDMIYNDVTWNCCGFCITSEMNRRPPVISRVCRESRAVAFRNRVRPDYEKSMEEAFWIFNTKVESMIDSTRDSVNLNFVEQIDEDSEDEGDAVEYFAWHAQNTGQDRYTMTIDMVWRCYDSNIRSFPELRIVMKKVVIHATWKYATRTGLFGLLGDAPILMVDISDEKRLKAFFELAEEGQRKGHVCSEQKELAKELQSSEALEEEFKRRMGRVWKPSDFRPNEKPPTNLRGVIEFRLCDDMCNHTDYAEEGFRPPPESRWRLGPSVPKGRPPYVRVRGHRRNRIVA